MLRARTTFPALALLSLAGCGGKDTGTTAGPATEKFTATLNGSSAVPAVTSTSSGTVTFEATSDSVLTFSLSVANLTGVTQAHLHTAAAGANGATVAWLLPVNGSAPLVASVALNGTIAIGEISPSWIRTSPRLTLDSVKALMRSGRMYVDVHTAAFSAGELRGQVARAP